MSDLSGVQYAPNWILIPPYRNEKLFANVAEKKLFRLK